ncbi:MAG TPA: EI24 domain-containing protein [Aestuariivirgaceae bacterium]|jgi:CysZ protein
MLIYATVNAFKDIFSRPFRLVLWKSLGLTLLLFAVVFFLVQLALSYVDLARFDWLQPIVAVLAGLGVLAAMIVLTPAVTALFAGLFLDQIAEIVEAAHYSGDPPGRPVPAMAGLGMALRFALLVLFVNLITLPFLLIGLGAVAMIVANAYLLSREFFEMTALRHLSPAEVQRLRREYWGGIFLSGFVPSGLMLIPLANLFVPVFATSYFTHLFKSVTRG